MFTIRFYSVTDKMQLYIIFYFLSFSKYSVFLFFFFFCISNANKMVRKKFFYFDLFAFPLKLHPFINPNVA